MIARHGFHFTAVSAEVFFHGFFVEFLTSWRSPTTAFFQLASTFPLSLLCLHYREKKAAIKTVLL
jgi:hypothetical protein